MVGSELRAMLAHDESHWWYRGRRRVLRAELDRLPPAPERAILDVGCGSGRTLDVLERYGHATGVDLSGEAVAVAHERGHAGVRQAAAERLPFADDSFDLVTCLDVLEHTRDDRPALRELLRVTRPDGCLIVTVPAYPLLWSRHDELNLHRRRYTRRALARAARETGWEVRHATGFNALLLPPAAAVRLVQRLRPAPSDRSDLERTPAALDRALELPLALEAQLLRAGIRLPWGLSLLMALAPAAVRRGPARAAELERAMI